MLTGKQRAYLRGKANSQDALIQIGKNGISEGLIEQVDETLAAKELVKGKVLNNSLFSAREAADDLAKKCGAEVVQVIGSIFVLYRENPEEAQYNLPK
ncbi:MAG: ribosome assembly RNA-binding protein YhbY [Halanaerobium sp.]|nr:ribosome assembly RNA-binding protein YhbY [Halanaerobium sp.]